MVQPNLEKALMTKEHMGNYNLWIYKKVSSFLGKRVLDIGSGTGTIIELMYDIHRTIFATDIFENKLDIMRKRFKSQPNITVKKFNISTDSVDNFLTKDIDTITCINVLEHIEDDLGALENFKKIIVRNGKIVIFVPAYQFLFGTMDKNTGHYRRYNPKVLGNMGKKLGLKTIHNSHMNFIGTFPWFLNGKILKKTKPYSEVLGQGKIKIYDRIIPLFEGLERIVPIPFGLSEIIVFQKD